MAITIVSTTIYGYTNSSGVQVALSPANFNDRGDYSNAATYVVNDVVTYLGALYICLSGNTGIVPDGSVSTYWSILVEIEPGTAASIDCCTVGSNALTLAGDAYAIAVAGTNLAGEAYVIAVDGTNLAAQAYALASDGTSSAAAYTLASIGTNVGTNAYDLAQSAFSGANAAYALAIIGTNSGGGDATAAYNLAAIGTDVGTTAYNLAQSAFSGANSAFSIAVAGTNAASVAQSTANSALSGADAAYALAVIGTNTGGGDATAAYNLAAIGTNVGTNALVNAASAQFTADSAFSGANSAFSIAVAGTNAAQAAQSTANSAQSGADAAYALAQIGTSQSAAAAYSLAAIGTNVGTTAYNLAQSAFSGANSAFSIAIDGTNLAQSAYNLAAVGTDTGTNAYYLAQQAKSGADAAYALAIIGTNTGGGGGDGPLALEAWGLANIGTNVGTNAYNLATAGSNLANHAFELAVIGTNALAKDANGNLYTNEASGTAPGSMTNGLYMIEGVAPTSIPNNQVAMWVADLNGSDTKAAFHVQVEDGTRHVFGGMVGINNIDPQSTLDVNGDILAKTYETYDSAIQVLDLDTSTIAANDLPFPDAANVVNVAAGTISTVSNVRTGAEYTIVPTGDVLINHSSSIVIRGGLPLLLAANEAVKCVGRGPTSISILGA